MFDDISYVKEKGVRAGETGRRGYLDRARNLLSSHRHNLRVVHLCRREELEVKVRFGVLFDGGLGIMAIPEEATCKMQNEGIDVMLAHSFGARTVNAFQ